MTSHDAATQGNRDLTQKRETRTTSWSQAFPQGPVWHSRTKKNMELPPCEPTTCRDEVWGRVQCQSGVGQRRVDPRRCKLTLGMRSVTLLAGKKPELVWKVERYQLDIFGLTSTHSTGSGTKLLERSWTLFWSHQGERNRTLFWSQAAWGYSESPAERSRSSPAEPAGRLLVTWCFWEEDSDCSLLGLSGPWRVRGPLSP